MMISQPLVSNIPSTSNKDVHFYLSPVQGQFVTAGPPDEIFFLIGPMGEGKCHKTDTPLILHDGTVKKVQNIVVGDRLMGEDSSPRTVLSLARGREEMFEIVPIKGDPFTVNKSHVLSLKRTPDNLKNKKRWHEIVNIPLSDYLNKSKTFKNLHHLYHVPVEFPFQPVPLDPYILGIWLGDGDNHRFAITTPDEEVVQAIYCFAEKLGVDVTVGGGPERCPTYHVTPGNVGGKTSSLTAIMKSMNLFNNKHIPQIYKSNSKENRLKLLAGLIDSDGWVNRSGYQLMFKPKQLADDVAFLARSLGFMAIVKPRTKGIKSRDFEGTYFHVMLTGNFLDVPVRIKRKQPVKRMQKKDPLVTGIKSIKSVGIGDYYGFEIDGNHLYLLGDFTVTHNTFAGGMKIIRAADLKKKRGRGILRGAIIRDTGTNLSEHTIPSLKKAFGAFSEFKQLGLSRFRWLTPNHEAILFGIDSLKDLARLQGPEFDYIWLEEPAPIIEGPSSGLPSEVFDVGYGRLRGTADEENDDQRSDYKWLQVTMNPGPEEHWTHLYAIEDPRPGTKVFNLPFGSNKYLSKDSRRRVQIGFKDRPDLAKRYIQGEWGSVQVGEAVTPEYRESLHRSPIDLDPLMLPTAYRVWDGWHNPVCGIWQRTPSGRLFCLDTFCGENMGVQQLIETQVKHVIDVKYKHIKEWIDFGDETMLTGDQSNNENSAAKKINELLGASFQGVSNNWNIRRESMKTALGIMIDGEPMIYLSKHERNLHLALKGGWHYPKSPAGVIGKDPVKDKFSHPGDMFSYTASVLVGYRPPAISDKTVNQKTKRRAKSYVIA